MRLVLFIPWAMIGAFGCAARNSFHTAVCLPGNSAFNTTLSGTSNSLNSRPTRVMPQSIAYWRKASFTRSGLRVARSGRKTGPWPKPNSSTNRAKLTATFLPAGQAATWIASRGKPVTASVASCAEVAEGSATAGSTTSAAIKPGVQGFQGFRVMRCLILYRSQQNGNACKQAVPLLYQLDQPLEFQVGAP